MGHVNEDNVQFLKQLKKNKKITINDFCKAYYDAEIYPFPKEQIHIMESIAKLTIEILPEFPYKGRINEFGNHMENLLIEAVNRILQVPAKNLGSGYPDVYFNYNGNNYYPECKVGRNIFDPPNSFRMFYTSLPSERTKKIKNIKNGYHLLFHFEHNMKQDGIGSLSGKYKITDLDGFYYTVESIQQGNGKDLYEIHNKIIIENK